MRRPFLIKQPENQFGASLYWKVIDIDAPHEFNVRANQFDLIGKTTYIKSIGFNINSDTLIFPL
jgi:hypothetical protein